MKTLGEDMWLLMANINKKLTEWLASRKEI